jgi:hypothetical protein
MLEAVELYNSSRCTIYAVDSERLSYKCRCEHRLTGLDYTPITRYTLGNTTINPTFVQQNYVLDTGLAFTTFRRNTGSSARLKTNRGM